MPLYICNTVPNTLDERSKERIARDITDIHCAVTGAPEIFVHVAFFEDSRMVPLGSDRAAVRGTIRKGRSGEQKDEITHAIQSSLDREAGITERDATVTIAETPASWVLEGGEIMPEPGEEEAWLEAHKTTHSQGAQ
ncbi:MAG: tautomerase family protein [Pseudomonadota bacterium]